MRAEQTSDVHRPAVQRYDIAWDGLPGEPHFIVRESPCGGTEMPDLVLVSGPLCIPAAQARALRLAARHAAPALVIAVVHASHDSACEAFADEHLRELYRAFDSVLVVSQADAADLADRLIRAITVPGDAHQVIGCDWNDLRHIVGGAPDTRDGGYGFGRATGERRATSAAMEALEQLSDQGFCLSRARGLCIAISAARPTLLGREIKEVMRHIRPQIHASATVAQCIDFDDTMADGAMEVDIFAFGECAATLQSSVEATPEIQAALASTGVGTRNPDPLYESARGIVLHEKRVSISLVQRRLRIAYLHATRLLDAMEGDILSSPGEDGTRTIIASSSADAQSALQQEEAG